MRLKLLAVAALALALPSAGAQALIYGADGNDRGGIISWSPEAEGHYRQIADEHCAYWNKISRMTSYVAGYGNFIGFVCEFPPGYDPVKAYYQDLPRWFPW